MSTPPANEGGESSGRAVDDSTVEEFEDLVLQHLDPHLQEAHCEGNPELALDLAQFCSTLREANRAINLTGIADAEGMAIRHCLDSVVALPFLVPALDEAASPPPLVDIGSGCGVPGIPLALARPDLPVVLIESRKRKAAAIDEMVQSMGLGPRVQLVHARAEAWLADNDAGTLVTRAVGPVRTQLELFGPLRKRYRRLVMLKGPGVDEELKEAAKTRHKHKFPEPERHEVMLPGEAGKRVVLVFAGGR